MAFETNGTSSTNRSHVLIIGAGITGVLIGQGLKKAGVSCTIFEAESSQDSRPLEWTIAIHWSIPFLRDLLPDALYARLIEVYCDRSFEYGPGDFVPMLNGGTGENIMNTYPEGMIRVSRRRMRKLCSEGLDIKYGKTLTDLKDSGIDGNMVTAYFADGSASEGSLLVGTDGPNSRVREHLLGAEKAKATTLDLNFNLLNVRFDNAETARYARSVHPIVYLSYHPDGIFSFIAVSDVPDASDPTTWLFQLAVSWQDPPTDPSHSNADRLALIKQKMEAFAEPFASTFQAIPADTRVYNGGIRYWKTIPWRNHKGKITLAGDAAHPLPPFRGQGLNVSIVDGAEFVDAVSAIEEGKSIQEEAISNYDAEMIKRSAKEVEMSVDNAYMIHDWSKIMASPLMQRGIKRG